MKNGAADPSVGMEIEKNANRGMSDDPIWEQAMDWHERLRAGPADAALAADIERWRAADPAHEKAWIRVNRVWDLSGAPPAPLEPPVPANDSGPALRRKRRAIVGGALAASLALALALPQALVALQADHFTGTAATETLTLADGTTVMLAPESALAVNYSQGGRQVELLRGQAFFDVTHDPARPFTVQAGDDAVRVLGTAFDVSRTGDATTVAVARGAVRVSHEGRTVADRLLPGEEVRVPQDGASPHMRRIAAMQAGAWRKGRLVAENMRLTDLVDEVGRYHLGAIVIADPQLASRRVTGIFDLGRPEAALVSAARPFGAKVRRVTPWLLIIG